MNQLNITNHQSIEDNYSQGLLPQRNHKDVYYSESSCRSNLSKFNLSSENRRILRKTDEFSFNKINLQDFDYNIEVQKKCRLWAKAQNWDFPTSSIKTIFTNHIFNYVYQWTDQSRQVVAYAISLYTPSISHIAYVFYHPDYSHGNLPIRLALQVVIDSHELGLKYCYLGRFSKDRGFYKRNMPGFEYFDQGNWQEYSTESYNAI